MRSSSHTAMSSRTIVVLMFLLPLTMTSVLARPSTLEHCLRLQLNPPSPPPPAGSGFRKAMDLSRIVCKDMLRAISYSLISTGKLPLDYLGTLCHILGDNEQKVERYVTRSFRRYDFHKLMAGRSCATIRKRQHSKPPSSLSRL